MLGPIAPDMPDDIRDEDVHDLIEFLFPFDLEGTREKPAEMSVEKYPVILKHLSIKPEDSEMISALKTGAVAELEIMEGLVTVEHCKSLVTYLKQTLLSNQLPHTVKQEVSTRWNSHLTMLQSLDQQWDEVSFIYIARFYIAIRHPARIDLSIRYRFDIVLLDIFSMSIRA